MVIDVENTVKEVEKEIEYLKSKTEKPKLLSLTTKLNGSIKAYLNSQAEIAKKYGIDFEYIKSDNLYEDIKKYNKDISVDALFIAKPLKKDYDDKQVAKLINPKKDIEGISYHNIAAMFYEDEYFIPCTAESAVKILEDNLNITGKKIALMGRSYTVGKPISILLQKKGRDATLTLINSKTKGQKEITKSADAIIIAIGIAEYLNEDFVSKGQKVIDVGINVENGKLVGDAKKTISKICDVTPVPGGVGSVTSTILMRNVYRAKILNRGF
jgi:methylenetetrahydrofolate dehydrogenase (NADP+)/methenyltetrahydrofolate cyclohydrolase